MKSKIVFLILLTLSVQQTIAQQWTTLRLTPGSTTLPSGNGWLRYYPDHKFQIRLNDTIRNFATEDWVSKNFPSGNFWNITGTTNVSSPTISGGVTFSNGRIQFTPDASRAGLNIGGYNGSPSGLINGDVWYNGSNHRFNAYINSTIGVLNWSTSSAANRIPFYSSSSGQLNSSGNLEFSSNILNVTGTQILGSSFSASSGSAPYTTLTITPTFNTTGTYSGTVRGIYYNPTNTSLTGATHIAFENTSGEIRFGGITNDNSKTRLLAIDDSNNRVYYRDASGFLTGSGVAGRVAFFNSSGEVVTDDDLRYSSSNNILTVPEIRGISSLSFQAVGSGNMSFFSPTNMNLAASDDIILGHGGLNKLTVSDTRGVEIDLHTGANLEIKGLTAKSSDTVLVMNNGVGYKLVPDVQHVDVVLTDTQIRNALSSPVVLVECPDDHTIVITSPVWFVKTGANAFSDGGAWSAEVRCGVQTSASAANAIKATGTNYQLAAITTPGNLNTHNEKDAIFITPNGAFTGGNGSSLRIRFTYIIYSDL